MPTKKAIVKQCSNTFSYDNETKIVSGMIDVHLDSEYAEIGSKYQITAYGIIEAYYNPPSQTIAYKIEMTSSKIAGENVVEGETESYERIIDDFEFSEDDMPAVKLAAADCINTYMREMQDKVVYVDNEQYEIETEYKHLSGKVFAYIDNAGETDGDVYGLSINNEVEASYNNRGIAEISKVSVIDARRVYHDSKRPDQSIYYVWQGDESKAVDDAIKENMEKWLKDAEGVIKIENDEQDYEYLMEEFIEAQFTLKKWTNALYNDKKGTAKLVNYRERLIINIVDKQKKKKSKKGAELPIEIECLLAYGEIPLDRIVTHAERTIKSMSEAVERGIAGLDFSINPTEEQKRMGW